MARASVTVQSWTCLFASLRCVSKAAPASPVSVKPMFHQLLSDVVSLNTPLLLLSVCFLACVVASEHTPASSVCLFASLLCCLWTCLCIFCLFVCLVPLNMLLSPHSICCGSFSCVVSLNLPLSCCVSECAPPSLSSCSTQSVRAAWRCRPHVLRQGRLAVQDTHELEVITREFTGEGVSVSLHRTATPITCAWATSVGMGALHLLLQHI